MELDFSGIAIQPPDWVRTSYPYNMVFKHFMRSEIVNNRGYRSTYNPIVNPKNETKEFVSHNRHYNTDERFRIAIYNDLQSQKFLVTYDKNPGRYVPDTHVYVVLSEHDTLNEAQLRMRDLSKEHFRPILKELAKKKSESIIDTPGQLCKTQIGFNTQVHPVRIGDHVTYDDKLYTGWIFIIEQEDLLRTAKLRIHAVYCGLEQKNKFRIKRMCVDSYRLEHVDILALGRSFQQLKTVIDNVVKTKQNVYEENKPTT